ncbi:MAG: hypothetical protein AAF125_13380 [Chloroflexota bacterium]
MSLQPKSQNAYHASTSSTEWRWVIVISIVIVVLVSIPLLFATYTDSRNPNVSFMGAVYNPFDGGTYLSKIQLGREGFWRTYFRHSPNADEGAYLDLFYTGLGHVASPLGLTNIMALHAARLLAAIGMCLALYYLGATIWRRTRNRRLFFIWVMVGSGFGWILVFFGVETAPDLVVPESFPLFSAMTNAHFAIAFALVALSAAVVIRVFRPGFEGEPAVANGGLTLFISSLILSLIAPHVLVPFVLGLGLLIVINGVNKRRLDFNHLRWVMIIVLPAIPAALYYLAELRYNPVVANWSAQNLTPTPLPWLFLAGYGLPLICALPGLYRAVRRFEPDGDQFMLLWLIAILVMVYFPTDTQRRFAFAIMIPITYFAVRTLDDLLFLGTPNRRQNRIAGALVVFSSLTYILQMIIGLTSVSVTNDPRFYLHQDYVAAFDWIDARTDGTDVVLASPVVGLWLPGQSGVRVVYGHPYETINATENLALVNGWYAADQVTDPVCDGLLAEYNITHVLIGPHEDASTACTDALENVQTFGEVTIYAP